MLIRAYDYVKEKYGEEEAKKLFLYGQEVNPTTYAIAKMNAIVHGIKDINLVVGDTLKNPRFKDGESFRRFDVVIANPPWNQDGYGEAELKKLSSMRRDLNMAILPIIQQTGRGSSICSHLQRGVLES